MVIRADIGMARVGGRAAVVVAPPVRKLSVSGTQSAAHGHAGVVGNASHLSYVTDPREVMIRIDPRVYSLIDCIHKSSSAYGMILPSDVRLSEEGNVDPKTCRPWACEVSRIVRDALGLRREPRNVVYPFAGFDLATVVATFVDADVYVVIDSKPFIALSGEDLPTASYSADERPYQARFEQATMVRESHAQFGGSLPLMLGKMRAFFPSLRIRSIQYFVEEFVREDKDAVVHGIVSFDLGTGQRPKTAIYLNHQVGAEAEATLHKDLWSTHLAFADGLLIRAAMGHFRRKRVMRECMLRSMIANGGVIVEGAHMYPKYEAFTRVPQGTSVHTEEDFKFSYFIGMRAVLFGTDAAVHGGVSCESCPDALRGGIHVFNGTDAAGSTRFTVGDIAFVEGGCPAPQRRPIRVNDTLQEIGAIFNNYAANGF